MPNVQISSVIERITTRSNLSKIKELSEKCSVEDHYIEKAYKNRLQNILSNIEHMNGTPTQKLDRVLTSIKNIVYEQTNATTKTNRRT